MLQVEDHEVEKRDKALVNEKRALSHSRLANMQGCNKKAARTKLCRIQCDLQPRVSLSLVTLKINLHVLASAFAMKGRPCPLEYVPVNDSGSS